jgi:hypothetical protein
MLRLFAFNLMVLSASLVATALGAGDESEKAAPVTAKAAFERLKTLKGDWVHEGEGCDPTGEKEQGWDRVQYKLTGAGSALVEVSGPGTKMEMLSVYHLDGEDLVMVHYCPAQNQPRLKLDRGASKPDRLVFAFDGGSNIDPAKDAYISGLTLTFKADSKVDADWQFTQNGTQKEHTTLELTRSSK